MNTATLSSQIRQMWDTRPLRARQAPIAGVCTGFARRYQVDVALVRAAVIGATVLGGVGVIAYIVGIFALPKEPPTAVAAPQQHTGPSAFALAIAAGIAVLFGSGLGASWPGASVISAALLLAGWYALHQRVPTPPPGTAATAGMGTGPAGVGTWQPPQSPFPWQAAWHPPQPHETSAASDAATDDPADSASDQAVAPNQPIRPDLHKADTVPAPVSDARTEEFTPPRWDPLGAAPFAWDLPEPASSVPVPVPVTTPRSRITTVTLGAALLVAAALAALDLTGLISISAVLGASAVLAVIAVGLLFGAFRRTGYGLLFVAIPLAGFVVVAATAQNVMTGIAGAPRGDRSFTVTDPALLQDSYTLQAGSLSLDLSHLRLDHDRTIRTRVAVGDTTIRIPETMNAVVQCSVSVGEARCPEGLVRGTNAAPGAPTLKIVAHGNVGDMEVTRVR